jgi:transcriptional regulator GlxA family with amidase domain
VPVDHTFRSRLLAADVQRRLTYHRRTLAAALYVRANLAETIRLDDVAEVAGMTPSAFSRYFAEKVGMTLSTVIKTLRIERALEELERRDSPIATLAEKTGYQSCCTFSRAFKEIMGETPSEYRRNLLFAPASERAS